MIKKIDAYLTAYFPILVAAYFIYHDSYFATHIFMVCWLSMAINMTFSLETYDKLLTTKNSLISILSIFIFGAMAVLGYISLEGFLLSIIIGENTALIIGIIISFIYRKGMKAEEVIKMLGLKETIGFVVLFTATIYPYIGEWIIYLINNFEIFVVISALVIVVVNVSGKMKTIAQIQDMAFNARKHPLTDPAELAKESLKMSVATINILVSLGIWFFGVGIIYAVYVHNR